MTTGPGKYDDMCTYVRQQVGLNDGDTGGVVVIVLGGNRGPGFAIQADLLTTMMLPALLENVAQQIREDTQSTGG